MGGEDRSSKKPRKQKPETQKTETRNQNREDEDVMNTRPHQRSARNDPIARLGGSGASLAVGRAGTPELFDQDSIQ